MAFYKVFVGGKAYVSRDTYRHVFGVWESRLVREPSKIVIDTILYGPLTDEQSAKLEAVPHITQDLDAQLSRIAKANKQKDQILSIAKGIEQFEYGGFKFVKMAELVWDAKYREIARLPVVRFCGRSIYIALDAKDKDISKPLVITE